MKQDLSICSPCPYYKRGYVQGYGDPNAKLMFIGEAPGMDESFRSHQPFTGPAGLELDRFLHDIGISRDDIYLTNVVKCNPPGNEDPKQEVIDRCVHYLNREVGMIHPEVIVTLGAVALRRFLPRLSLDIVWGVPQFVGDWNIPDLTPQPHWIFPIYHPALGLHQTRMLPMIEEGFKRLGLWLSGNKVWEEDCVVAKYDKEELLSRDWHTFASVAVDTETTWDGNPLCVQFSGKEGEATLYECNNEIWMKGRKQILEHPDLHTIMHNAMFDLEVLHQLDIHPAHIEDTMVMAYLLGDLPQGLKPLAYRLCGMDMKEYGEVIKGKGNTKAQEYLESASCLEWPDPPQVLEFKEGIPHVKKPQNIGKKIQRALNDHRKAPGSLQERWKGMEGTEVVTLALGPLPGADLRDVEEQEAITYACKDADATRRIYPILKHRIEDEGLQEAYEMDMGIIPMLLEMQRNGITVDKGALTKVGTTFERNMMDKERELQKTIGYHINPGSSQQVAEMMDKRGIQGRKRRGKSGQQSTGVEILEPLRAEYPEIGLILDWRKYETLMSMFIDVIPKLVREDGKVHTTIKNTRTITGRLAMENPNLQQQPVRTEESRLIRNAFVASPGYGLASFDYSQIEMRVIAHESQDKEMIRIFLAGLGIHEETAAQMFHIPVDQVEEMKHRYPAKRTGFGILYGISGQGLAIQMEAVGAKGWTAASCDDLIAAWFTVFWGVANWQEETKAHARRYGWVADMFGRRRLTPEVHSTNKKIREEGLRYAMNQPVQSGAQGVIKKAMVRLWQELLTQLPVGIVRPLLQIHDDILIECKEGEEWVLPIIQEMMETAVKLSIPTPVEPKIGERWGSMQKANK